MLHKTNVVRLNSGLIAVSGIWTSEAVDITDFIRYISLQWGIVGTGAVKIEILSSNDGVNFLDVNIDVATAQVAGWNMASVSFIPSAQIKIRATETGAANPITNINFFLKGY